MIKINPEKEWGLKTVISNFYCSKNQDIENFLKKGIEGYHSTAVMLEKREITRTFFIINNDLTTKRPRLKIK